MFIYDTKLDYHQKDIVNIVSFPVPDLNSVTFYKVVFFLPQHVMEKWPSVENNAVSLSYSFILF